MMTIIYTDYEEVILHRDVEMTCAQTRVLKIEMCATILKVRRDIDIAKRIHTCNSEGIGTFLFRQPYLMYKVFLSRL